MKGETRDKYELLWKYVADSGEDLMVLSFDDAEKISGVPIDHSFLKYKRNLISFGYEVKKISLKAQTIEFVKCEK